MKYPVIMACLIMTACSSEPQAQAQPEPVQTEPAEVKKTPVKTPNKTFGITPKEYGNQFGKVAKDVGLGDIGVSDFDLKKGKVNDVFTIKLSDAITTNGTVDKNGELKSITYIMGQTDKGETAIMNMAMMAGITARALSPELSKEETGGKLIKLLVKSVQEFTETKSSASNSSIVGNIKYTALADPTLGIWITFEPK